MKDFLVEVGVVGIMVMIIGIIISYICMYFKSPEKLKNFEHWWSIAFSFAVAGMLVHIICEVSGINTWYCRHGAACKRLQ